MSRHPDAKLLAGVDDLAPEARAELLRHVEGCAECRARIAESDPSRLFGLLELRPIPTEALDRLSERVGLTLDREAGVRPRRLRRLAFTAAAAVLAVLAILTFTPTGRMTGPPVAGLAESRFDTLDLDRYPIPPAAIGGIELISSPGNAQVLDLSVGDTEVMMIFDEGLDI